ncbi:GPR1/FUN34/YaaH family transporter [Pseudonocardia sp. DLS-67]
MGTAPPSLTQLNAQAIGMPMVAAGSLAFGLAASGYAPVGALIPILGVAVVGGIIAARLAAQQGLAATSSIFGAFAGFWLSYIAVVLGLANDWYGVSAEDTSRALVLFLASWLAVAAVLTLINTGQPFMYVLLLVLFGAALVLLLVGSVASLASLFIAAGAVMYALTAVAIYICVATVGPASFVLPLGPRLINADGQVRDSERAAQVLAVTLDGAVR